MWRAVNDMLKRTSICKDLIETFGWMGRMVFITEKLSLHPEWDNVYNTVYINFDTYEQDHFITHMRIKFRAIVYAI